MVGPSPLANSARGGPVQRQNNKFTHVYITDLIFLFLYFLVHTKCFVVGQVFHCTGAAGPINNWSLEGRAHIFSTIQSIVDRVYSIPSKEFFSDDFQDLDCERMIDLYPRSRSLDRILHISQSISNFAFIHLHRSGSVPWSKHHVRTWPVSFAWKMQPKPWFQWAWLINRWKLIASKEGLQGFGLCLPCKRITDLLS